MNNLDTRKSVININGTDKKVLIFSVFNIEFYIIKEYRYYKTYHLESHSWIGSSAMEKTLKETLQAARDYLTLQGKEMLLKAINYDKIKKIKEQEESQRIAKANEEYLIIKRENPRSSEYDINQIIYYTLTLENGNKLIPKLDDIKRIRKENIISAREINPAYKFINKCKTYWNKGREDYIKLHEGEVVNGITLRSK